ncbi:NAD-dependent epimerase/dehydratase family protein [Porticoccus sp. W117]|uniref:NAD-dependent epimerase/dehydratase family protein n=1 Tax=Porticoccus sp. W117 TaxID=3054777 RepID=UPI00259749D5|nr:NAD-dependent epimerase/dehydratase family protein [Porticoccus sp. W117]MDM3870609.1 NAD-dependent epimerase/dehydratase family protein [Porticoccus sp. W117]
MDAKENKLRVGFIGVGNISSHHKRTVTMLENVDLVAVCDFNNHAANQFISDCQSVQVFDDADKMLAEANLDVVHVLTQPDSHYLLAKKVLEAGCHAVVEKPIALNCEDARELIEVAENNSVTISVNHNFIYSTPYKKLQKIVSSGDIGPIKSIRVVWKKHLPPIDTGPWNLWMLRQPDNLLYETAVHTVSELLGVLGGDSSETMDIEFVDLFGRKKFPTGGLYYSRWSIAGRQKQTAIKIDIAVDQGYEEHYVEVEGLFGVARADIEKDICTLDRHSGKSIDGERLAVNWRSAFSRLAQSTQTYFRYAVSRVIKSIGGGPYEICMSSGIKACYETIRSNTHDYQGSTGLFALQVITMLERIRKFANPTIQADEKIFLEALSQSVVDQNSASGTTPTVLVIGATGFIGKALLKSFVRQKISARTLVRNPSALTGVVPQESIDVVVGDYRDESILRTALEGVESVIHLAVTPANSYPGYVANNVDPTKKLIDLCQKLGIKRFIYSGTIDSLHLGPSAGLISENDGIDKQIQRRNNYARSKADIEQYLAKKYRDEGFPAVVVRPAIVIGEGGAITHLGVANWFGLGVCRYWGKGENLLPFVLVDDVANAIAATLHAEGVVGKSYNLSAEPSLSARDYVQQVEVMLKSRIDAKSSRAWLLYTQDMIRWAVKRLVGHPDGERTPSLHDWQCRGQYAHFDTSNARQDLNWQPESRREELIRKGIEEPLSQQYGEKQWS